MEKDVQIELIKFVTSLPTTALLVLFIIAIYRDFRALIGALLVYFNRESTAWLSLFRDMFKSERSEKAD